jgi:hypothetical protein
MIGLDDVVQVFRGSAHHVMRQVAFALQVLDRPGTGASLSVVMGDGG